MQTCCSWVVVRSTSFVVGWTPFDIEPSLLLLLLLEQPTINAAATSAAFARREIERMAGIVLAIGGGL
jgi:hypothetical protein